MLLKKCTTAVAEPLSIIFNKSVADGHVPAEWKKEESQHCSDIQERTKNRPSQLSSSLIDLSTLQNYGSNCQGKAYSVTGKEQGHQSSSTWVYVWPILPYQLDRITWMLDKGTWRGLRHRCLILGLPESFRQCPTSTSYSKVTDIWHFW